MIKKGLFLLLFVGLANVQMVQAALISIKIQDKARLQRGAKVFINYCSGCHSLKYMRYNQMAKGLGLVGIDGTVDENLLRNNLVFTQALINDPIHIALPPEDAKQWFGMIPPDLSLIARAKGGLWLSHYLKAFYNDNARPFGVNNSLVPDVAMPNVLGTMSVAQRDEHISDLVDFLIYAAEPAKPVRLQLGIWVIVFLLIFLGVIMGLQNSYKRRD